MTWIREVQGGPRDEWPFHSKGWLTQATENAGNSETEADKHGEEELEVDKAKALQFKNWEFHCDVMDMIESL